MAPIPNFLIASFKKALLNKVYLSFTFLQGKSTFCGIVCGLACSMSFSTENLLLFRIGGSINPFFLFVISSSTLTTLIVFFALSKYGNNVSDLREFSIIFLCGLLETCSHITMAFSVFHFGAGNAVAVFYVETLFVTAFSVVFFRKDILATDFIFAVIPFTAVALIVRPSFIFGLYDAEYEESRVISGVTFALTSALTTAGSLVLGKVLLQLYETSFSVLMISYSLQYWLISIILCTTLKKWELPDETSVVLKAVMVGIASFSGIVSRTVALKLTTTTLVSILQTSEVPITYFIQCLFFRSKFYWTNGVGSFLIIVSSIGLVLTHQDKNEQLEDDEEDCDLLEESDLTKINTYP